MEPDWPPNDEAVGIQRERRAVERLQVCLGVLISIPGHLTAQSCLVRDFSLKGAGIRMTGIALLPYGLLPLRITLASNQGTGRPRCVRRNRAVFFWALAEGALRKFIRTIWAWARFPGPAWSIPRSAAPWR
jgi:hypothetical protein